MKKSIIEKLEHLCARHEELSALLGDAEVIADQKRFRDYSKEYAQLESVVKSYQAYQNAMSDLSAAEEMLKDNDPDVRAMAEEELTDAQSRSEQLAQTLQILLLPQDPNDTRNIFLEVRAGTGGDEAAIFSGDLARMYMRYAENRGWRTEIMSESAGEHGGYKEIIIRILGTDVYSQLKFESGAHRVQRVPETESQGRVHTSACTVAVLPEVAEIDEIHINPSDLKIDTYRSSGAGGQHVNTTDSAIRITHLPTGIVVECQDERSQHKNKARALSLLSSRILSVQREKQQAEQSAKRRNLVGSGDRSERIRTYNYPQGRVTDHRINLTLYKLSDVMEGELDLVVKPLIQEHQADLLADMSRT